MKWAHEEFVCIILFRCIELQDLYTMQIKLNTGLESCKNNEAKHKTSPH